MTLQRETPAAPDRTPSPPVLQMTGRRDPRAAVFVCGLVAASPSGETHALVTFARRIAGRRLGEW